MILAGRVTVDGQPAAIGQKVTPDRQRITVDGKPIGGKGLPKKKLYYIALHKPRGVTVTMDDPHAAHPVADLVTDIPARVYPVGRLDKESEGLLLMTNDGAFAQAVAHPSAQKEKSYRVSVRFRNNERMNTITDVLLSRLETGIDIDGKETLPCTVHLLESFPDRHILEFKLKEGRNRQIRKMCAAVGLDVLRLKRTSIGCVRLGNLAPGKWRHLTKEEVQSLLSNI